MISSLSPKSDFLKHHEESAKLLSSHREDKWLHVGLAFATLELSTQGVDGKVLKLFCDTFLQMGEPNVELPQLPVQTLTTYDSIEKTELDEFGKDK